jgi:hypothetical protein
VEATTLIGCTTLITRTITSGMGTRTTIIDSGPMKPVAIRGAISAGYLRETRKNTGRGATTMETTTGIATTIGTVIDASARNHALSRARPGRRP